MSVGADGEVYAIDADSAQLLRRRDGRWQYVRGRFAHVAVGDRSNVWAIGEDDRALYVYAGDERGWRRPAEDPLAEAMGLSFRDLIFGF